MNNKPNLLFAYPNSLISEINEISEVSGIHKSEIKDNETNEMNKYQILNKLVFDHDIVEQIIIFLIVFALLYIIGSYEYIGKKN